MVLMNEQTDFTKLWKSNFYHYDKVKDEYFLLDGAPPDIIELFEKQKTIEEEEQQTGRAIF